MKIELPEPFRTEVLEYARSIDDDDILELEDDPHVTIKYGLQTNDVSEVAKALGEFPPINLSFGVTSMFAASPEAPYDVLKIDAVGASLKELRERIEISLPTKDRWISYSPHVTLGYLKPHRAMGYLGNNPIEGRTAVVNQVVFNPIEGSKSIITNKGEISNYA